MRHHNNTRKFGRTKNQRVALLKSLVLALITRGKIKTTEAKAKELRPKIEKLVTRAKTNTLASRRIVLAGLYNNTTATAKLFKDIAPQYTERKGGYTRITKLPRRITDGAPMAVIEFV